MRFHMNKICFIISLLLTQNCFADIASSRQDELLYLIKHDCGSCHGMTLKGGLGPALLPETLAAQAKDYLAATIMEGRTNTAMPGWKGMLTQAEAVWMSEQLQHGITKQTEITKGKTK